MELLMQTWRIRVFDSVLVQGGANFVDEVSRVVGSNTNAFLRNTGLFCAQKHPVVSAECRGFELDAAHRAGSGDPSRKARRLRRRAGSSAKSVYISSFQKIDNGLAACGG
jgi:hypothetical protein